MLTLFDRSDSWLRAIPGARGNGSQGIVNISVAVTWSSFPTMMMRVEVA